jgi:hypothetical protein
MPSGIGATVRIITADGDPRAKFTTFRLPIKQLGARDESE